MEDFHKQKIDDNHVKSYRDRGKYKNNRIYFQNQL